VEVVDRMVGHPAARHDAGAGVAARS
jgi:hypothetical protein